jgi:hypothetical protein
MNSQKEGEVDMQEELNEMLVELTRRLKKFGDCL